MMIGKNELQSEFKSYILKCLNAACQAVLSIWIIFVILVNKSFEATVKIIMNWLHVAAK